MLTRFAAIVFVILLGTFSIAQDAPVAAKPEKATIFFYRVRDDDSLLKPNVFLGRKKIADMRNGRFFSVYVNAGPHSIASDTDDNEVVLDAKPGGKYYVKVTMGQATFPRKPYGKVALVDSDLAKFEMSHLKLSDGDDLEPDAPIQP
jgi:Protein of unknown function (DUF2846)